MRAKSYFRIFALFCASLFIVVSCSQKDEPAPVAKLFEAEVPEDFNYETFNTIPFDITFQYSDNVMKLEEFEIYADAEGTDLLFTGISDLEGHFSEDIVLPSDIEEIYLKIPEEGSSSGRTAGLRSISLRDILKYFCKTDYQKIEIRCIELDDDKDQYKWRIRNPYQQTVSLEYKQLGTGTTGTYDAPPGDSFIYTDYVAEENCQRFNEKNTLMVKYMMNQKNITVKAECKCQAKTFCYTWPMKKKHVSFAFEDYWPKAGDYDMNDVVVDAQFKVNYSISRFRSNVKELVIKYRLKHSGASFHNGFAIQLPVRSNMIKEVVGTVDHANVDLSYEANGVESGQSKATIIVFENTRSLVDQFDYYNPSDVKEIVVKFKEGVRLFDLTCKLPFNPFIFNAKEREDLEKIAPVRALEVHLPRKMPTDLADVSFLEMEDENGMPRYLTTPGKYPWAIMIPMSFEYPMEKVNISDAYPQFEGWVSSGGRRYMKWYKYPKKDLVIEN